MLFRVLLSPIVGAASVLPVPNLVIPTTPPDWSQIKTFVPGPGLERVADLSFDIARLREELATVLDSVGYDSSFGEYGFGTLPVTRRPGTGGRDREDIVGTYWLHPDYTSGEEERDEPADEWSYTAMMPEFEGTYFEEVVAALRELAPIGRVRINTKAIYNANSWHRDPEPRLHIPIVSNPGSLFVINHHVTHLPADGSVYFTDTRAYHTALNGGDHPRVHLVAALPQP